MRLIDADALGNRMYHESFEKDSDLQRWDGGCWIRYKLFEQVLREAPTIDPTHSTPSNTLGALDCVSRQDAIGAICSVCGNDCDKSKFLYDAPQDEQIIICPEHYVLTQLPSAQKTGKWIKNDNGTWSCNRCHSWIPDEQHYYANFCLYCGCRMEEGDLE